MTTKINYPKFTAGMSITQKDYPDIHFTFAEEVPKEIMDNFESIVGNAHGRVSVSVDMGIKDFGTGAGSMVTVSLAFNQDETTFARAALLAGGAAKWYANNFRQDAEVELNKIVAERKQQNLTPSGRPNFG